MRLVWQRCLGCPSLAPTLPFPHHILAPASLHPCSTPSADPIPPFATSTVTVENHNSQELEGTPESIPLQPSCFT